MTHVLDSNRNGSVSEYLKQNTLKDAEIDIISPLFTIYAFEELQSILDTVKKVRFLFNEPTFIRRIETNQKEVKEFHLELRGREKQLSETAYEINLKNNLDQNQVAFKCYDFIEKKVEVRSITRKNLVNTSNFFVKNQYKPFLISGDSVSFSMSGLGYTNQINFNFNTVISDNSTIDQFENFFNNIWNNNDLTEGGVRT